MSALSILTLVQRRLADEWMLLVSIFAGITISATLVASAPIYIKSLERLALDLAIEGLLRPYSNINTFVFNTALTSEELDRTEQSLHYILDQHIRPIHDRHERYLIGDTYLAGMPLRPLPASGDSSARTLRAYFRHYSNMEHHVTFLDGRMAGSTVTSGPRGPRLEAVVGATTAEAFDMTVGDVVTVTPDLEVPKRVSVQIVGVVEAPNPTEDYWKPHANLFLDPPPPEVDPTALDIPFDTDYSPVPLFVTQEAMVEALGQAYPGTLIDSLWFILVDKEPLKGWSLQEARSRLDDFENDIARAMPGSDVSTGIHELLDDFERRSFFSRAPLLLLLAVMVVTVLFFLSMMVSYLVQSRERDAALLRTRGVGTLRLLRLYALEGLIMAALAVALAPFLALGLVALAGKLPYFRDMTGGDPLPVEMGPAPFLAAAGAGLLCLAIFVLPGALGARGGLLALKLRSARPPTVPFFHRYYLDVALLSLGGLTFWELHSRGQLVSGGLFKGVELNETLLVAPVLLLIVVALVFMRLFPLVVRFVSGESPALLHLLAAATLLSLATGTAIRETVEGDGLAWTGAVALLVAVGAAYWATGRAGNPRLRLAGLVLQAGLVGGFVALEPPVAGQVLFAPTVGLICVVPAQVAFLLLKASARAAPVWLSMGLWHMARNPLQYTWLVLLLVLLTGLGIMSTTVGGTLERSQTDRIMYEVGTDIRVSGIPKFLAGGIGRMKETYLTTPGVTSVSLGLRDTGSIGQTTVEVLAVESQEFPYISWYRKDFSDRPLTGVMGALRAHTQVEKVAIPEGATTIGIWARPEEVYANMSMWMVIEDDRGDTTAVSLGRLGPPEWRLMSAPIPARLKFPLYLASVQIFEPGHATVLSAGSLLLDHIHVGMGPNGAQHVLEDFEGPPRWTPIITSALSPDRISFTSQDAYRGNRAAVFSFGKETDEGVRGFYVSPTGGPIPIVVSSPLADTIGVKVDDAFVAVLAGRRVPVVIRDTVDHFPTMSPDGELFILTDLYNLLGHLNILKATLSTGPNELFLTQSPAAQRSVREATSALDGVAGRVYDRAVRLESARLDPLTTAGWNSLVLLSLAILLLAAALGYTTYLLSFAMRSRSEMGFLESMGLSRRQLMGLLGFEHLAVAAVGLGLGTWAGFQMSGLMVSSVAVTQTGDKVVPPFVLVTDWALMGATYAALATVFLAALFVLSRTVRRLDLQTISRVEGY